MRTIWLVEPNKVGLEHIKFNKAMIDVCGRIWSDHSRLFFGAGATCDCIGQVDLDTRLHRILVVEKRHRCSILFAAIIESFIVCLIYILCSIFRPRALVFLSMFPVAQFFLKSLSRVLSCGDTKVLLCQHGELEWLDERKSSIFSVKFWIRSSFMTAAGRGVRLVFLSRGIFERTRRFLPKGANCATINHPQQPDFSDSELPARAKDGNAPLVVGLIGSASAQKGSHQIFALADHCAKLLPADKMIEFRICGKAHRNMFEFDNGLVKYSRTDGFVPADEYNRMVSELDCALFLYPEGTYGGTASGAVTEAVMNSIPIIALKSAVIIDIFDEEVPGKLCSSFDEVVHALLQIAEDRFLLGKYGMIMTRYRERFSIESVSLSLSEQIGEDGKAHA